MSVRERDDLSDARMDLSLENSARGFCQSIDELLNQPLTRESLTRVVVALASVLAAALAAPMEKLDESDLESIYRMNDREWEELFVNLRDLFGERDSYLSISISKQEDSGVETRSLADDLADVYRELKTGLIQIDSGVPRELVQSDWRDSFRFHWAEHSVEALRALVWHLGPRGGLRPAQPRAG